MKKSLILLAMVALFITISSGLPAEEKKPPQAPPPSQIAVSKHVITLGGQPIAYTATAAMMPICDDKGEPNAQMFYIAYTKEGVKDTAKRPLLFSFNGGPGSCSVWLHMGYLGPRRVVYDDQGFMPQPPFKMVDNDQSILDEADIVFIDPIGTGYSRMLPGKDAHMYHGVSEDIQSVAEFIRLYVSRHQRWHSPKFIIGESYGTTRAAGLSGYLQSEHRMYINGTILVSSMDLGVQMGEDLDQALLLPHYAATAWYHKCLAAPLQAMPLADLLKEVEKFCLSEYASMLIKGNTISVQEKTAMAEKLQKYSGIPGKVYLQNNLRLAPFQFRQELLSDAGLGIGRLDSRYKAPKNDRSGLDTFDSDPAMNDWNGPFTATVNQYMSQELGYKTDVNYAIFGEVHPWKGMRESRVGEMLHQAMIQNPYLNVLILGGYYDGATDYFSIQYAMNHLDLAGVCKDRIKFAFYESGHMMYLRKTDLIKAKQELARFINGHRGH